MSRLLTPPILHRENVGNLADFVEIECLRRADGSVSLTDVSRLIEREHGSAGNLSVEQFTIDAFTELAFRAEHCGDQLRHPYRVSNGGSLCTFQHLPPQRRTKRLRLAMTYLYLLLATRMNMRDNRMQAGEDATTLFEHVCREVVIRYCGGPSASVNAIVFGTGRVDDLDDEDEIDASCFATSINNLCKDLKEGREFDPPEPKDPIRAKDGKLDVVVWKRFADNRAGQFIGFGQCKTGTHWTNDLTKLQPEGFCDKWMRSRPAVIPMRFYFITDRPSLRWYDHCKDGGIVLDRCRIMEHSDALPTPLSDRVISWVKAAMSAEGLRLP